MNDSLKNVFLKVQNVEVKKRSSPSTPRDFFEKLYGNVDSFKKSENKLPKLTVVQPVPLKLTSSQHAYHSTPSYHSKNENSGEEITQKMCSSVSLSSVSFGTDKATLSELKEDSSDSDVDVDSENEEETSVSISETSDKDTVIEGYDNKLLLLERSPWLKQCSQTSSDSLTHSSSTTARIPLPLPVKHQGRAGESSPFYVRQFMAGPHEGHFPPGLTAFCKYHGIS